MIMQDLFKVNSIIGTTKYKNNKFLQKCWSLLKHKEDLKYMKKLIFIFFLFHRFNIRNKQKLQHKSCEFLRNSCSEVTQMYVETL